jgi:hypothetical protein
MLQSHGGCTLIGGRTSKSCCFPNPLKGRRRRSTNPDTLEHYCCPTDTLLHDCKWRGKMTDCPVANCEKDEVNVALDGQGDRSQHCACEHTP